MAFASGKYANAICQRCGFKYKYLEMTHEPGTKLYVCPDCNDGMWSMVDHPQNHPPKKLTDAIGLRYGSYRPTTIVGAAEFGQQNPGDIVDYVSLFLLTP